MNALTKFLVVILALIAHREQRPKGPPPNTTVH
jgi:hypothetical protein